MASRSLTDRIVADLQPEDKPKEYSDADCTGLVLRVQPSGKKTWYIVLWSPDSSGQRKRYRWKIGEFPDYRLLGKAASNAEDRKQDVRHVARRLKVQSETEDLRERRQAATAAAQADATATLGAFLDSLYLDYCKANHKGDAEAEVRYLKSSFSTLLDKRVDAITSWDIQTWMKKASKTLAPGTIHRRLGSMAGVLSLAVRKGLITINVLSKVERDKADIKIPKPEQKPPRYLLIDKKSGVDEEAALRKALIARDRERKAAHARYIAHCDARPDGKQAPAPITGAYFDHLHPLILLALNTGIRRGGLLQLRWSDIKGEQVYVRQAIDKGGKGYWAKLSDEAKQVLRLLQKQTGASGDELVFTHNGNPIKSIKSAWATLMRDAGIKGFTFHCLRHSYASKLVQGGVPLYTVSQLLGHSSLEMTMKYAHLSPDHFADALKVLNT